LPEACREHPRVRRGDGFFVPSDANVIESTSAGKFNASFARCAVGVSGAASYWETAHFTQTADCWLHVDMCVSSFNLNGPETDFIVAYNSSDTAIYKMTISGASSHTVRQYYSASGVWTQIGSSFTFSGSEVNTIDIHFKCNSSGSANLYFSGTNRLSGSANTAALTGTSYVRFKSSVQTYWSQFIAADESTVGMRVGTIYMTGNGANTDFTGDYTAIDETAYSDVDEITSGSANQVELYTGTPVPSFTGYTIRAVGIGARAKYSGSAPTQLQLSLRSAGTNYFSATRGLDAGYGAIPNVWNTDPRDLGCVPRLRNRRASIRREVDHMTVEVTKLAAYGVIGPAANTLSVSKLVAYVVMYPGTESGGTPPAHKSYTYAHILDKPNPVGAQ
jgi:hypothetical protein